MADEHGCEGFEIRRLAPRDHVGTLRDLLIALRGTLTEWLRLRWTDLHFTEAGTAFFMLVVLLALSLLVLTARRLWSQQAGRTQLGLPAVLSLMKGSYW